MRRIPDFTKTTSLVARALGITPEELLASFRPAQEQDLQRVATFRSVESGGARGWDDAAFLKWRYRFGSSDSGRGECWLLERGGEILAIVGTEDVKLAGAVGPCCAVFLMDILVRTDVRGIAVGPWMNMALLQKYECVAVLGSNDNSSGMVSRQFDQQLSLRTYYCYLNCDLALRKRMDIPFFTTFLAAIGNLFLRGWRAVHAHTDPSVRVMQVTQLKEIESVLSQWSHAPNEVGRQRFRGFLEWRTIQNPRSTFRISGAWRGEKPVAYLVVRDAPGEVKMMHLVDWFCAPQDDGNAIRTLITAALKDAAARKRSVVAVSLLHERSEVMLRQMGFLLRPLEHKSFVYTCRDPHPLSKQQSINWYLTTLDGDVD